MAETVVEKLLFDAKNVKHARLAASAHYLSGREHLTMREAADEIARLTELLEEAKEGLRGIANAVKLGADTDLWAWASLAAACQETGRATLAKLEAQPLQRGEKRDDARPMSNT